MDYDAELWNKYTDDNVNEQFPEISSFIYNVCIALGAKKVLEAGSNVGNDLISFPNNFDVHGIDRNAHALEIAKKRYPDFTFKNESLSKTSFTDSFFDLVFTRDVLVHVPQDEIKQSITELHRISKKWIMHMEYYGNDGQMIEWKRGQDLLWYRNMKELWSDFNVDIITDVEIPVELDFGKNRITIVRKLD
jgi:SAM-dependent methyltransferase